MLERQRLDDLGPTHKSFSHPLYLSLSLSLYISQYISQFIYKYEGDRQREKGKHPLHYLCTYICALEVMANTKIKRTTIEIIAKVIDIYI